MDDTFSLDSLLSLHDERGKPATTDHSVLASIGRLLQSVRDSVDPADGTDTELDLLLAAITTRRRTIQTMTAELRALDAQLGVLERAVRHHTSTRHTSTTSAQRTSSPTAGRTR